jgi:hypothetical protein
MRTERRWKVVAILATGIMIGVVIAGTPAGAHVGGTVAHLWNKHIKPKADKRYANAVAGTDKAKNANKLDGFDSTRFFPGGNLPRGKTIRGIYRVTGSDEAAGADVGSSAISFGWTLASAPTPHFVAAGTPPPPECPGNAANPHAAVGHLCVFEVTDLNAQAQTVGNPVTNTAPGASRYGAFVVAQSVAVGTWATGGTWAVTAP